MRLNGPGPGELAKKKFTRMQDVNTSGFAMASGPDGLSLLSESLSSRAGFFPKTRTNIKKRVRIFSVNSNRIFMFLSSVQ